MGKDLKFDSPARPHANNKIPKERKNVKGLNVVVGRGLSSIPTGKYTKTFNFLNEKAEEIHPLQRVFRMS